MDRFQHRNNEFHVPKIYWNLTRERILTMEYIDGVKVNDVERLREIGVDPKWVGRILQDVFAEMYVCASWYWAHPSLDILMTRRFLS